MAPETEITVRKVSNSKYATLKAFDRRMSILRFARSIQTPVGRVAGTVEAVLAMPTIAMFIVTCAVGWTEESINQSKPRFAIWNAERDVRYFRNSRGNYDYRRFPDLKLGSRIDTAVEF